MYARWQNSKNKEEEAEEEEEEERECRTQEFNESKIKNYQQERKKNFFDGIFFV